MQNRSVIPKVQDVFRHLKNFFCRKNMFLELFIKQAVEATHQGIYRPWIRYKRPFRHPEHAIDLSAVL